MINYHTNQINGSFKNFCIITIKRKRKYPIFLTLSEKMPFLYKEMTEFYQNFLCYYNFHHKGIIKY